MTASMTTLKAGVRRLLGLRSLRSLVFAILAVNLVLAVMAHFQTVADQADEARIGLVNEQRMLAERIPRHLLEIERLVARNSSSTAALFELKQTVKRIDLGMERLLREGGAEARRAAGAGESGSRALLARTADAWKQLQPALNRLAERPDIAATSLPATLALSESAMPMVIDLLERLQTAVLTEHDLQMDSLRNRNRVLFALATLVLAAAVALHWRLRRASPAEPSTAPGAPAAPGPADAESGSDMLWSKSAEGVYTSCNAAYARLLGRPQADIIGKTDFELTDLRSARSYRDTDRQAGASGQALTLQEWRTSAADGRRRLMEIVKTPLWDAHGGFCGVQVVARDITRRAQAEAALKRANARLQLLETSMAHVADAIIITEAEPIKPPGPRIVFVNKAFESMTGFSAAEAVGNTPRILQGPDTESPELNRLREALAAWRPVRVQLCNYTKQGRAFWVELDVMPVADDTGWFTHWVSVQRDVTARKLAESQWERGYRMARETASVQGALLQRLRRVMHAGADAVTALPESRRQLEQVCALSEVLAGGFRMAQDPYSMRALLQRCASRGDLLPAATPARIHADVADDVPATCTGDEQRLQQALSFLMQYLLQHSRSAELWLRAQCSGPDLLHIAAITRTSSLPPDEQAALAEALSHAHDAPLSSTASLEPELFVARDLAARMGGRMGSSAPTASSHHLWMELPLQSDLGLTRPALLEN